VLKEPFSSMDFDFKPNVAKDFSVRRSDIDTNNHVNNKRYINWILETLPQNIYDNYMMESLDILYKKEAGIDSAIQSGCMNESEPSQSVSLVHRLLDKKSGLELAAARTIWRQK